MSTSSSCRYSPTIAWFESLRSLPENRRHSDLGRVAARFRRDGQEERLARLVESLNRAEIYNGVQKALQHLAAADFPSSNDN